MRGIIVFFFFKAYFASVKQKWFDRFCSVVTLWQYVLENHNEIVCFIENPHLSSTCLYRCHVSENYHRLSQNPNTVGLSVVVCIFYEIKRITFSEWDLLTFHKQLFKNQSLLAIIIFVRLYDIKMYFLCYNVEVVLYNKEILIKYFIHTLPCLQLVLA